MTAGAVLAVRGVSKSFFGLKAVQNINLDAVAGQITAVIGPNGAGKTTLFNCITGLVQADRSETELRDESGKVFRLAGLSPEEICKLGLARTFQQIRLFDSLSVVDNVMLAVLARKGMTWHKAIADRLIGGFREHRKLRAEAERFLGQFGLGHLALDLAGNLDHGNRRRLEIARALATRPKILLLDEPAAGMNRVETDLLMAQLEDLRNSGIAVVLIEHDMKLVMSISDRVYVMDHGELLTSGTPREVATDSRVIEAYLGSATSHHAHG